MKPMNEVRTEALRVCQELGERPRLKLLDSHPLPWTVEEEERGYYIADAQGGEVLFCGDRMVDNADWVSLSLEEARELVGIVNGKGV